MINFLDEKEYKNYWANSGSNRLAADFIRKGSRYMKSAMEDLIQGKTFCTSIDEENIFSQLDYSENAVWSLLLASGYLKVAGKAVNKRGKTDYLLALTNLEVRNTFENMFIEWFSAGGLDIGSFSDALPR